MGILDKFLKKDTEEQQAPRIKTEYTIPSLDGKNEIMAYGLSNQGQIKHKNQEITNLIMGRITKYKDGNASYSDASDYISFELPLGQEVTEKIMQAVIKQYDREDVKEKKRSHYIGRLEQKQGIISFGNKSNAVEKIVRGIIDKNEKRKQEQMEASIKAREKREAEFRESIAKSTSSHVEKLERIREQRKAHPTLTPQGKYQIDGKMYSDYDGIDVDKGDILRIRKVDKLGKDGSGTYLYSAYLNTTPNEYDVESLEKGEPGGYPVCFTLEKRLEDIVKEGNIEEISTLLNLLSNPGNFENSEQLAYIGGIDKNGEIIYPTYVEQYHSYRNDRGLQFSSDAIKVKIQSMQQEYERKRIEKRKQEGRGE